VSSGAPETTRGRLGRIGLNIVAIIGFIYLFLPIAVIVAFSFNKPAGKFNIVWKEFTLDNWANPFESGPLMDAMGNSLKIATLAALGATILGSLIAIALVRYRFSGNAVVDVLLILPLTAPEIVLGASLLSLFLDLNWQRGFWTVVIAHVLFCTSFVALTVKARIRGFDWTLEDAAMDLGATPSVTFRRVTLPLITPGIIAASLLSFALSIDDFIITFFNAGTTETFPLRIFGASRTEISPQINVLATVILLASVGLLLAGVALRAWREGRTFGGAVASPAD